MSINNQPSETQQHQHAQSADGDAGVYRPIVNFPFAIHSPLQFHAQVLRKVTQRCRQSNERGIDVDSALQQRVHVDRISLQRLIGCRQLDLDTLKRFFEGRHTALCALLRGF